MLVICVNGISFALDLNLKIISIYANKIASAEFMKPINLLAPNQPFCVVLAMAHTLANTLEYFTGILTLMTIGRGSLESNLID